MSMTLHEAIERLRPGAEDASIRGIGDPRGHRKASRAALAKTEARLIASAQRCGMLPPFLVPIVWKLIYAIAWQAIQYWVNTIHSEDA